MGVLWSEERRHDFVIHPPGIDCIAITAVTLAAIPQCIMPNSAHHRPPRLVEM